MQNPILPEFGCVATALIVGFRVVEKEKTPALPRVSDVCSEYGAVNRRQRIEYCGGATPNSAFANSETVSA